MRRNFLKILGSSIMGFLVYPFSLANANNLIGYNKKLEKNEYEYNIINQDLNDDQKRVMSPKQAIKLGADYLVIGRPITQSDDISGTLESIFNKINNC